LVAGSVIEGFASPHASTSQSPRFRGDGVRGLSSIWTWSARRFVSQSNESHASGLQSLLPVTTPTPPPSHAPHRPGSGVCRRP